MLEEVGMKKVEKVQFVASYFSPKSLLAGWMRPPDRPSDMLPGEAGKGNCEVWSKEGRGGGGGNPEEWGKRAIFLSSLVGAKRCARMTIHN